MSQLQTQPHQHSHTGEQRTGGRPCICQGRDRHCKRCNGTGIQNGLFKVQFNNMNNQQSRNQRHQHGRQGGGGGHHQGQQGGGPRQGGGKKWHKQQGGRQHAHNKGPGKGGAVCPMCGQKVGNLAQHVLQMHDEPGLD